MASFPIKGGLLKMVTDYNGKRDTGIYPDPGNLKTFKCVFLGLHSSPSSISSLPPSKSLSYSPPTTSAHTRNPDHSSIYQIFISHLLHHPPSVHVNLSAHPHPFHLYIKHQYVSCEHTLGPSNPPQSSLLCFNKCSAYCSRTHFFAKYNPSLCIVG